MKQMLKTTLIRLRMFGADLKGSLSVETVLIFPVLSWCYIAMFIYFDAFRAQSTNLKAAYTISDMLSRELDPVNASYLDGLNQVFDYLTNTAKPTWIRVTVVTWDDTNKVFKVQWSHATKNRPSLTNATISQISDQIPVMPEADSVIVVETTMAYEPAFSVGLGAFTFDNLVVTRPRFAGQLKWVSPIS